MENIKATHTLSWYKDRDNIPNQTLVDGIIKYFTVGPRKDFWDIEDLLNLLWGARDYVLENKNTPDEVIERLQNLPLQEEQKHVLFGLLLKLVGGYPVANLDEKYQFALKRIEVLFLGFPGDTPEKEFCRFDIDDRARINALSTLYTDAVNGKISKPDLAKLHKKIVGTKRKEFENIDELIDDAVETGRINEDAVKNRTEFKIDFNKWLGETKGWDLYDENEYKKLLTISNLQEYVNQGRGTYEDVMIPSVFKSIIDRHKFAPTFSHYEEYGEIAKSYRYNGLSIKYEDGFELFISSRNIAIFFFVMMPEIAHQEQNAILDDFRRGYEAGYSQVETTINERLGALQHTNENVQVITVRLYAELYSIYNNSLFWRRNAFEQIGHNQGQLYRLKVMMRAIDSIVLAVDAGSSSSNAGTKNAPPKNTFKDYLTCEDDRKDKILEKLTPLFVNAKGKAAATNLIALHKASFINLPSRGKQSIYDAVNAHFGLSLTNQSYQPYITTSGDKNLKWTKITDPEIQYVIEILTK